VLVVNVTTDQDIFATTEPTEVQADDIKDTNAILSIPNDMHSAILV
jgi:hypothetical protein